MLNQPTLLVARRLAPSRLIVLATLTAIFAFGVAVFAHTANANVYSVKQCWTGYAGAGGWYADSNGGAQLRGTNGCGGGDNEMGFLSNANSGNAWLWEFGQWIFNAPGGATIVGYHGDIQTTNGNGWVAKLVDTDNNHVLFCGGAAYSCSWSPWLHHDIATNTPQLRLLLQCTQYLGSCPTGTADGYAMFQQRNVTIDINDPDAPGIDSYGGGLTGGWQRGTQSVSYNAWDPQSGVVHTWAEIDHARGVADVTHGCDDRNVHICADGGASGSIDTTSLADGIHTLYVYAVNGAQMQGGGFVNTFGVDNTPQDAPLGVSVEQGSAWQSSPNFKVDESVPGSTAPIVSGDMQICKLDDTSCQTLPASTSGVTNVTAPAAGEWKTRFRYNDAAGNGGAWSDWSAPIRYDGTPVASARAARLNGWINAAEIRDYKLTLDPGAISAQQFGPSGIAGYSVTTDGSNPDGTINALVPSSANNADDQFAAPFDLAGLSEGLNTVKVRAVSGSGLVSSTVDATTVKVDLTPPDADSAGAPAGADTTAGTDWQGHPVDLTFTGTDQPGLSGMTGAPTADPDVTHGAYMQVKVDAGQWADTRGATATLHLADTGDHTVSYRAVDLAGNVGATQSERVKVDVTQPGEALVHGSGWMNATTFLESIDLEPGTLGPSGLHGYAITTDGSTPGTGDVDTGSNGVYRLRDLPEGVTTLKARAITNAGVPAADASIGSAEVKIDRSAPTVDISGAPDPNTWSHDAVSLNFAANDQPGLSGIDRIDYRVDNGPVQTIDGDLNPLASTTRTAASLSSVRASSTDAPTDAGPTAAGDSREVSSDGTHSVTAVAYDKAGNASAPKTVTFHVQQAPPVGGMDPQDPSDPTKVSFYVSSQCLKSASIQMRKAGDADWKALDTQIVGDHVTAHIPDQAYAAGNYEVRAVVVDCAGNTAILDKWWDGTQAGEKITLDLPLRIATTLKASFGSSTFGAPCIKTKLVWVRRGKGKKAHKVRVRVPACPKVKAASRNAAAAKAHKKKTHKKAKKSPAKAAPNAISGFLATSAGVPIPGVPVQLEVAVQGSNAWRTVQTLTTDASGVVHATAPAGATSRDLRFSYAGTQTLLTATSNTLSVAVPANSTINASRAKAHNGQSVTFSGRLLGGYVPAGGRELELDGYNPVKHKWVPVQTAGLRADAQGRWKASYKFTSTHGRVAYLFRLRVSGQAGYPFAAGYSRTVQVVVTG